MKIITSLIKPIVKIFFKFLSQIRRALRVKKLARVGLYFFIFLLAYIAWISKDLPTPSRLKERRPVESTKIYARDGKTLLFETFGEERRTVLESNAIPDTIKKATIAIEDKNFFGHGGLDIRGITRSIVRKTFHPRERTQGGSTITQQFVKNALLSRKRTLGRKIKEAILAIELEQVYDKDEILSLYLNEVPYGNSAYGVQAASKMYFNKDASNLTLGEAAILAAIPKAPTYYSPYGTNTKELFERRDLVLKQMKEQDLISNREYAEALTEKPNILPRRLSIKAPHFVMMVREELVKEFGESALETEGFEVITTIDPELQEKAESTIAASDQRLGRYGANNAALVSLDSKTGEILAMVGSRDYFDLENDGNVNVTLAARQPGSAFKPIVYATAFKGKYNPAYVLYDLPTDFGGGYRPNNYNGKFLGPVTIRQALGNSLNIPAVKMLALSGLYKTLETAKDLGITTLNEPDRYGLSLVLGGGEVRPIELAGAFSVFANDGKKAKTHGIKSVRDRSGKELFSFDEKDQLPEVIDPQVAFLVTSILTDNGARSLIFGTSNYLTLPGRLVAAKTGTTQEFRDAWTAGYTPSMTTVVWVGNNDNSPMKKGADGSVVAAPIWRDFMIAAHQNRSVEHFPRPRGIVELAVDRLSNKLPSERTPPEEIITDVFASWQVPTEKDDVHLWIRVDKTTGERATVLTPKENLEDRYFVSIRSELPNNPNWQEPVQSWAKENGLLDLKPPSEKPEEANFLKPSLEISSPSDKAELSGKIEIAVKAGSPSSEIQFVEFFIDGISIGRDSEPPYKIDYETSSLLAGEHALAATLINRQNQTANGSITIKIKGDTTPPKISDMRVVSIGQTSRRLTWTTDESATTLVKYGLTSNYDSKSIEKTGLETIHSVTLGGLSVGATYHFSLISTDSSGNTTETPNQTFKIE